MIISILQTLLLIVGLFCSICVFFILLAILAILCNKITVNKPPIKNK